MKNRYVPEIFALSTKLLMIYQMGVFARTARSAERLWVLLTAGKVSKVYNRARGVTDE
jgi:hypothetical protein